MPPIINNTELARRNNLRWVKHNLGWKYVYKAEAAKSKKQQKKYWRRANKYFRKAQSIDGGRPICWN